MIDPPFSAIFLKRLGEELQKVKNCYHRTVSGAYKATPVWSLWAEVGVPHRLSTWIAGKPDSA
jgi:hypothetical protein